MTLIDTESPEGKQYLQNTQYPILQYIIVAILPLLFRRKCIGAATMVVGTHGAGNNKRNAIFY